jgi:hypothetical protein
LELLARYATPAEQQRAYRLLAHKRYMARLAEADPRFRTEEHYKYRCRLGDQIRQLAEEATTSHLVDRSTRVEQRLVFLSEVSITNLRKCVRARSKGSARRALSEALRRMLHPHRGEPRFERSDIARVLGCHVNTVTRLANA